MSNRAMSLRGSADFAKLKKVYSKWNRIRRKTIGLIGLGRIGQELASCAFGLGMNVIATDPFVRKQLLKSDSNILDSLQLL